MLSVSVETICNSTDAQSAGAAEYTDCISVEG